MDQNFIRQKINSIIRSDVNKCSYFWNNRLRIEKWWIQIPAQKKEIERERERERENLISIICDLTRLKRSSNYR